MRHAQILRERNVGHGVFGHRAHGESFAARDAAHLDGNQQQRGAHRIGALLHAIFEESNRNVQRPRARFFDGTDGIAIGLGRALEQLRVIERTAQPFLVQLFAQRKRSHFSHGAASKNALRCFVPQHIFEMRDVLVAFDDQGNSRGFAIIEQSVTQGEIEKFFLPLLQTQLLCGECSCRSWSERRGLTHFPNRRRTSGAIWIQIVFCARRSRAIDDFRKRMKSRATSSVNVHHMHRLTRLREPSLTGSKCRGKCSAGAARRRINHAQFAQRQSIAQSRWSLMHGVSEARVHRGKPNRGMPIT